MPRFPAKRICIIRTSAIGDVVNALVLANGLRQGYPQAKITWIVQDIPGELLTHHPSIDEIISYNRRMPFKNWLAFLKKLRNREFDLLIVPQVSIKASLIANAIRSPVKIGYNFKRARELSWLATNTRIPGKPNGHVLDQYLEFLHFLDITTPDPIWNIVLTSEELTWRSKWYKQFSKPLAVFVPASSKVEKDWNPAGYAQVIDQVSKEGSLDVAIVGGPGRRERELTEQIVELSHSMPVVALEKPLRHTLLQLSGARVVVSPDTGPLHMSVAMNVPTVALYGFSNPRRCGPYHFRNLLIDKFNENPLIPEPITRKTKSHRMSKITPDEVFQKIQESMKIDYVPDYPLK